MMLITFNKKQKYGNTHTSKEKCLCGKTKARKAAYQAKSKADINGSTFVVREIRLHGGC